MKSLTAQTNVTPLKFHPVEINGKIAFSFEEAGEILQIVREYPHLVQIKNEAIIYKLATEQSIIGFSKAIESERKKRIKRVVIASVASFGGGLLVGGIIFR